MRSDAPAGSVIAGWYGKLPSLGDFAHRRVSARFIERWDEWLQGCLAAAQAEVQDSECSMPIEPLRFWLAPKLCEERALCGVIVASADRVGRRFPLTILAVAGAASDTCGHDTWFEQAESIAHNAIANRMNVDDFDAALAGLPPPSCALAQGMRSKRGGSLWWSSATAVADPTHVHAFSALPPLEAAMTLFGAPAR